MARAPLPGTITAGWRAPAWRIAIFALVTALGFVALCAGAGFSDRDGIEARGPLAWLYYSFGLFVFGGIDLGVPAGGPEWARGMLWFAFFAAPAITTTAVVEGVLRATRPEAWRLRRLRRHVVIGGCGRLAMLYLQRLRALEPRTPVLICDHRADHPNAHAAARRYRAHVVVGDVTSEPLLDSLRLRHADSVVLLTGDDHANLSAAARIRAVAPRLAARTTVHVSDIRLLRLIEAHGLLPCARAFNSYRLAATHLVNEQLLPHFRLTDNADPVVLAGFGRFGQTVLHVLQEQAGDRIGQVVVVDRDADRLARVFDEQIGFDAGRRFDVLGGDIRDPSTWSAVGGALGEPDPPPVIVLGTGDDGVNVRTALTLAGRFGEAKLVARAFTRSAFAAMLSNEVGFDVVGTADLLLESMQTDAIPG